jgi:hypothetical protein
MYAFLPGLRRGSLNHGSPLTRRDHYRPFPQIRPSLPFQGNAKITDIDM